MKKRIFLLISVIPLLGILIWASLSVSAASVQFGNVENRLLVGQSAEVTNSHVLYSEQSTYNYVMYEDEDDVSAITTLSLTSDTQVCGTVEELVRLLREQMKQRKNCFSIELVSGTTLPENFDLSSLVFAHTGIPTEGDYLRNHCTRFYSTKSETETGNIKLSFEIEYVTTYEQEKIVDKVVADIVKQIDTTTNYSAISDVYKYIRQNVSYDSYHFNNVVDHFNYKIKQTAYGALIDGTAVCEGYSVLFYRLALECGVDARVISGVQGIAHVWNLALNDDGIYYGVDTTNDLFMFGETAYEGEYFRPSAEYWTDEFRATYPMVWDIYTSAVDYSYDRSTATMTIHSDMENFVKWGVYTTSPWTSEMINKVEHVIVEKGVTHIGDYAFYEFPNLKTVSLPDTVVRIGDYAFYHCFSLGNISLPESLKEIGEYSFFESSLSGTIHIPDGVVEIKDGTFGHCGLTSVTFSENAQLKRIGYKAFRLSDIETLVIPSSLEELGGEAFEACNMLTSVVFQNESKLKIIIDSAFDHCIKLQNIVLPSSLEYIGNEAFKDCKELGSIVLPNNVTYIGNEAFWGCQITSIELPKNLEYIGDYAFNGCTISSLHIPVNVSHIGNEAFLLAQKVTVDDKNQSFVVVDGVIYTRDGSGLVWFPRDYAETHFSIPDGVKWIPSHAFAWLEIETIEIPDSLLEIPENAFTYCKKLTSIQIPNSVCEIGNGAFYGSGLVDVEIPGSVRSIGKEAFAGCIALNSVLINEGTTTIGGNCFINCAKLRTLDIPFTVHTIGAQVLNSGSSAVETIRYHGTIEDWKTIYNLSTEWLNESKITFVDANNNPIPDTGCSITVTFDGNGENIQVDSATYTYGSTYGDLPVPSVEGKTFYGWFTASEGGAKITSESMVSTIENQTLYAHWENTILAEGTDWMLHNSGDLVISGMGSMGDYSSTRDVPWNEYNQQIVKLTICKGVTEIGDYAFAALRQLTNVSIPSGVRTIGKNAFSDCEALTEIYLPDGLRIIDSYAFDRCYSLSQIRFPNSLTEIGEFVFRACNALTKIELPDKLRTIGTYAFAMNQGLKEIRIPASVENIGAMTFYACSALETAVIETGRTGGVAGMFNGCTALVEVSLAEGLTALGIDMFKGCTSLREIRLPNSVELIDRYAVSDCTSLKKVICGVKMTRIADAAFSGCSSLTEVNLPDCLQIIENNAFANCSSLQSISIPQFVDTIGHGVFYGCTSLKEIVLPEGIRNLGVSCFMNCTSLERVDVLANINQIPHGMLEGCSALTTVHLYNSINSIGNMAFSGCDSLDTIYWYHQKKDWDAIDFTVGNEKLLDVKVISQNSNVIQVTLDYNDGSGTTAVIDVTYGECYGELPVLAREGYSFAGWTDAQDGGKYIFDVTSVTCSVKHTLYAQWYDTLESGKLGENLQWALYKNGTLQIQGEGVMGTITEIPWEHLKDQIQVLNVDDGVKSISSNMFSGHIALRSVILPGSIEEIGDYAFYQCSALQSITIPESVAKIGSYALAECTSLLQAEMSANATDLGSHIFYKCLKLQDVVISKTSPYILASCRKLRKVDILNDISTIEKYAFDSCGLASFTVPKSVTTIEEYAFQYSNLQEVILQDGLLSIGKRAFFDARFLEKVSFPNSLVSISDEAFFWSGITEAYLPDSLTSIGKKAFYSCDNLSTIRLSPNCKFLADSAFRTNSATIIEIPDGVEVIGLGAFANNSELKTVTIAATVKEVQDMAFGDCGDLKTIVFHGDAVLFSGYPGVPDMKRAFSGLVATVYYPDDKITWTSDIMQDYDGTITWRPWYTLGNNPDCEHVMESQGISLSCLENYTLHSCQCGYSYRSDFAERHNYDYTTEVTSPTCTDKGYTTYTCHCGDTYIGDYVDALQHDMSDWTITKDSSCAEAGSKTRSCQREGCEYEETETIEATGHTHKAVVTAPTCTEQGYTTYTCSCSDTYVADYVDALKHDMSDWTTTQAPTCTEVGSKVRSCQRKGCEYEETGSIDATGHNHEAVVNSPTCTAKGYTTYTCDCGDTYVAYYVDALKHDMGDWRITQVPTCTESGTKIRSCQRKDCEYEETESIDATGHNHKSLVTDPTCTDKGYTTHTCSVCDGSYVDSYVDALKHDMGNWTTTKDATCIEVGSKTRTCQREGCQYKETESIEAVGHNHKAVVTSPTCTDKGYTTYTCACGDSYVGSETNATGHSWKDATSSAPKTCKVCGATVEKLSVKKHPKNAYVIAGNDAFFSVEVNGEASAYQWQYSTDDGETWKNSGAETATTDTVVVGAKTSRDGYLYRCKITDETGKSVYSTGAKLSVFGITTQPKDAVVKSGASAKFTVKAIGKSLSYQWYWSSDAGATWAASNASSATTKTFKVTGKASYDNRIYKCVLTDSKGNTIESDVVKLRVLAVTADPADVYIVAGENAEFTVKATGKNVSYQWQYSTDDGETWKDSGAETATTDTVVVGAKTSRDGYLYRCKITDEAGNVVYSDGAMLSVFGITTQPKDAAVKSGASAKFTVKAIGKSLSYQWYWSSDDGATWAASGASSATTKTFKVTGKASYDNRIYKCVITDSNGNAIESDVVKLRVLTVEDPADVYIVAGKDAEFTVKATGKNISYQWQYSTNDGKTWKTSGAASAVTDTVVVGAKTSRDGYLYRCKITDEAGNVVYSDGAMLSVFGIKTQPKDAKAESGASAKFTVKATGKSLTYQWYWSTDGENWKASTASSATTKTFKVTGKASYNGRIYYCVVKDAYGNEVASEIVELTVK